MGKRLCISKDRGETQYNWEFCYSINGEDWLTVLFEELEDAREYVVEVESENEDNPRYQRYARQILQVSMWDFIDQGIKQQHVRVVQRHSDLEGR